MRMEAAPWLVLPAYDAPLWAVCSGSQVVHEDSPPTTALVRVMGKVLRTVTSVTRCHEVGPDCWCRPKVEKCGSEDCATDNCLWVEHKRTDLHHTHDPKMSVYTEVQAWPKERL